MSEALKATIAELLQKRARIDEAIAELQAIFGVVPVVASRLLPAPRSGPSRKPRPAAKPRATTDRRACSEPGCDTPLRSDNTTGLCKQHAKAAWARSARDKGAPKARKAKASSDDGKRSGTWPDCTPGEIRKWREKLLAPILQHAPGTPERAEATAGVIGTTVDGPDGKPYTPTKTSVYMWLKQA